MLLFNSGQGPLEFLADDNFEISGNRIELVGDDRISLYSFRTLNLDTVNDFQAYASFIDFDSYGDIRLSTQTGNIYLDTIRDVILKLKILPLLHQLVLISNLNMVKFMLTLLIILMLIHLILF